MKGALWVWERDIRKFARQPFAMVAALVAPFLMLVLLGYAFGGTIEGVPIAIAKESDGPYSNSLVGLLANEKTFRTLETADIENANKMLEEGHIKAIIHIPKGFDSGLASGRQVAVNLYVDNTDPASAAAISSTMTKIIQLASVNIELRTPTVQRISVDAANYYRKVEYVEYMAPGSIVQSVFIASIIGGGISILFDKQRGIIEGYLVTPLKQVEIVVGFLLAGVTKAVFSATGMLILAVAIAGVRPTAGFFGFVLLFSTIMLTALGLISMMTAFAVRAPAPEVYQFTSFPINLILYFTSGAVYPIDGFPWWMKIIAKFNPETYAVHALRSIMYKGTTASALLNDYLFLTVFTGTMLVIATLAFKRTL